MVTNRMRRARGEIRMPNEPVDKLKATLESAVTRMLNRLGKDATSPALFQMLAMVAKRDFNLRFDGADPTDLCFIQDQKPVIYYEQKVRVREERKGKKIRRKYEVLPNDTVESNSE